MSNIFHPNNINDVDEWPSNFEDDHTENDYENLISQGNVLESSTLLELIEEEILSGPFAVQVILEMVEKINEPRKKLEFLQHGMSTWPSWPEVNFDGFHIEFLELMWEVIKVVDHLELDSNELSNFFELLIDVDYMWNDPIVLTSFIALKPLGDNDLNHFFDSYLGIWDLEEEVFVDDNSLDVFDDMLVSLAPLVAVSVLKKGAPLEKITKVLSTTCFPEYSEYSLAFWEYLSANLCKGNSDSYWAPQIFWKDGFFSNGIENKQGLFDEELGFYCLEFFWKNKEALDLANPYGEYTLQSQVLNILVTHPLLDLASRNELELFLISKN